MGALLSTLVYSASVIHLAKYPYVAGSSIEGFALNGHASPIRNTTAREHPELIQRNNIPTTTNSTFDVIRRRTTQMFTPEKKLAKPPGVLASLKSIITASCRSPVLSFEIKFSLIVL